MKKVVALLGVVALGFSLALGLLGVVAGGEQAAAPLLTYNFQYAAKVIQDKSPGTSVAPGVHFTSVNIHYPGSSGANYRVKVALSGDNGIPGPFSKFFKFALKPDQATQFDGVGFSTFLSQSSIPVPPFYEGYFVIESDRELDVVAVYTGMDQSGLLATMEIERVPPRRLPQP